MGAFDGRLIIKFPLLSSFFLTLRLKGSQRRKNASVTLAMTNCSRRIRLVSVSVLQRQSYHKSLQIQTIQRTAKAVAPRPILS